MTTLNLKVAASADDGRETDAGTNTITDSASGAIRAGAPTRVSFAAFRWSVAIPQGTTITSATLGLYIVSGSVVGQDVCCQQADNAGAFTTSSVDISSRIGGSKLTLSGTPSIGSYLSFDVTSIVQTIISRGGFVSGNYIAIIVDAYTPNVTSSSAISVRMYDGSSTDAAKLDIVYTASNIPPVADAGVDRTCLVGQTIQTAGYSGWDDDDNGPTSPPNFTWSKQSGPGTVTFGPNANVATPSLTFDTEGSYVVRFTVDDGADTAIDDVTITVIPNTAVLQATSQLCASANHIAASHASIGAVGY